MSVQSIGEPVRREEDLRLLKGRGRYVDDVREPNEARGYVLRSPHAHARIASLDATRARAALGVLAVLTGEDLRRRGLGTLTPGVRRRRRNGAPAFVCRSRYWHAIAFAMSATRLRSLSPRPWTRQRTPPN